MTTSAAAREARATNVRVGRDYVEVTLSDGRVVRAPIAWFPRLAAATQSQRRRWRLIGRGIGIRWDDVDEDISVRQLMAT